MFASFVPLAAASGSGSSGGSLLGLLVPLGLMGGIFYFLLIRPQQRTRRRQVALLESLEVGDEVQTMGGIFGTIKAIDEDSVMVEVAPGVQLRFLRGAIARKLVYDDYGEDETSEEEGAGDQK